MASPAAASPPIIGGTAIQRAVVVGGGIMGQGIASWLARHGSAVYLKTRSRAVAARFERRFGRLLEGRADAFPGASAGGSDEACASANLVIEAVAENLTIKQAVFRDLAQVCRDDAILASTTSTIPVRWLSFGLPVPQRVIGLHFFNPVIVYPLVECIYPAIVPPLVRTRVEDFVRGVGKIPVSARDGNDGCVGNRILGLCLDEAARRYLESEDSLAELERCLARVFTLDHVMEIPDVIGLDVMAQARAYMSAERLEGYEQVLALHSGLIEQGCLGRKTRVGIYDYRGSVPEESRVIQDLRRSLQLHCRRDQRPLDSRRFQLLAVSEALRCLDQGIASAAAIDSLMTMLGMRQAPLDSARRLGADALREALKPLAQAYGPRFEPPPDLPLVLRRIEPIEPIEPPTDLSATRLDLA